MHMGWPQKKISAWSVVIEHYHVTLSQNVESTLHTIQVQACWRIDFGQIHLGTSLTGLLWLNG